MLVMVRVQVVVAPLVLAVEHPPAFSAKELTIRLFFNRVQPVHKLIPLPSVYANELILVDKVARHLLHLGGGSNGLDSINL